MNIFKCVLQHFVGDFARCSFMTQFTTFFNVRSRIHWGPQNKMNLPDHNTGIFMAYSLRIVYGFFNVPHLF